MGQHSGANMPEADMERIEKARTALDAALSVKAEKPVVLDVRDVSSFADTFVLVSGRSDRQVRSIADHVERNANQYSGHGAAENMFVCNGKQ